MDGSTRVHPVGDGLMELNTTGSITGTTPPSEPNAPDDKSNKLEHNQSGTALDCSKQMKLLANERKEREAKLRSSVVDIGLGILAVGWVGAIVSNRVFENMLAQALTTLVGLLGLSVITAAEAVDLDELFLQPGFRGAIWYYIAAAFLLVFTAPLSSLHPAFVLTLIPVITMFCVGWYIRGQPATPDQTANVRNVRFELRPTTLLTAIVLLCYASFGVRALHYTVSECCAPFSSDAARWAYFALALCQSFGSPLLWSLRHCFDQQNDSRSSGATRALYTVTWLALAGEGLRHCCEDLAYDSTGVKYINAWGLKDSTWGEDGKTLEEGWIWLFSIRLIGVLEMLVALIWLLHRKRISGWLAKWLSEKPEPLNGSFIANLIGDEDPDELMAYSSTQLRRVPIQNITIDMLKNTHDELHMSQTTDPELLSEPCEFDEIDFFISHSWDDDAKDKFDALQKVKKEFEKEHNRTPTVWFDKLCSLRCQDEKKTVDDDLQCLPFFLTGCEKLLVLMGDSYAKDLWCVWELYIFRIMDGNVDKVRVMSLGDKQTEQTERLKNLKHFKDDATCSSKRKAGEEEQKKIRKIMGRDAKRFQKDVRELATDLESRRVVDKSMPLESMRVVAHRNSIAARQGEEALNQMDLNFDRKIDMNEFLAAGGTKELFDLYDQDEDGFLTAEELAHHHLGSKKQIVNAYSKEAKGGIKPLFASEIEFGSFKKDRQFCIEKTEHRAIKLSQLEAIVQHAELRLQNETWLTKPRRKDKKQFLMKGSFLSNIDLYTIAAYVIKPASVCCDDCLFKPVECPKDHEKRSVVEVMATEPQEPDFFVSHWWGEKVLSFTLCLKKHSRDHGLMKSRGWHHGKLVDPHPGYLGGRSPQYWVCAYALNQHMLSKEMDHDLEEMPFFLAIKCAKGTVSVLDQGAECFSRIWCVYELYLSTSKCKKGYTYELYTTFGEDHTAAVGISQSDLLAVDQDAKSKAEREEDFPFSLVEFGIGFKSADGEAFRRADMNMIHSKIEEQPTGKDDWVKGKGGPGHDKLDNAVHGVVAAVTLGRALKERPRTADKYFDAVQKGQVQHLRLNLTAKEDSHIEITTITKVENFSGAPTRSSTPFRDIDTQTNLEKTVQALDAKECEVLSICTMMAFLPDGLNRLAALGELCLEQCGSLEKLPNIECLVNLHTLDLGFCSKIKKLPNHLHVHTKLLVLDLHDCKTLTELPKLPIGLEWLNLSGCHELKLTTNLGSLIALKKLNMRDCRQVSILPDLTALKALEKLNLKNCAKLTQLPQSLTKLEALTSLNLEGCPISTIPGPMKELTNLKMLNLCNCDQLVSLPDLSGNKGLEEVQSKLSRHEAGVVYTHLVDADLVHSWKACGYAPGCSGGFGEGYGIYAFLCHGSLWKDMFDSEH